MSIELKAPLKVSLDRLYLDPNNPRLAASERPGYDKPARIFDQRLQEGLEARLRQTYKGVRALSRSIVNLGWVPVDPMLVWEHPGKKGHFVVLEGNTRTTVLRGIRRDLAREKSRLARAKRNAFVDPAGVREQQAKVDRYLRVVEATRELEVLPVSAKGPLDLAQWLPRLLGVRHLSHAQKWRPYATNLYVYSVYRQLFDESQGTGPLRLDDALLHQCADLVSLSAWKVRRAVQAVLAFNHFRHRYEERMPPGESLGDDDQSYFLALLDPGHPREEFGYREDTLWLRPEKEEVLFRWAFARPRRGEGPNRNVLRSADDIRLWARLSRYDERHHTRFARQVDVSRPDKARPMAELELEFMAHRVQLSPLETVQSLVKTLKETEIETVRAQHEQIRPVIEEMVALGSDYLKMLEAIEPDR
ncbi:MAG TPA: hypothetical protein VMT87_14140 [Vicinamibacteria bacterium]|nr:hypothetical protein [Vicinamibacteria bacterium]